MASLQLPTRFEGLSLDDSDEEDMRSLLKKQDAKLQEVFQREKGNFDNNSSVKGRFEPTLYEVRSCVDCVIRDDKLKNEVLKEIENFADIGKYKDDNQAYLNYVEKTGSNASDVQKHLETIHTTCEKCIEIESVDKITQLKADDHIRFRRSKIGINFYNHHAIIVHINLQTGYMVLVHFQKADGQFKVIQKAQGFKRSDNIDLIKYNVRPFSSTQIIERAEQMAEKYEKNQQAKAYNLFGNNCEHKSNEIVIGVRASEQVDSGFLHLKSSLGWLLKCLLKMAVKLCEGMKYCIRNFAHIAVIATFLIQIDELVSLRHKLQQGLICIKCFNLENNKLLVSLIFSLISIGLSVMFHTIWLYFGIMGLIAIALPFVVPFVIKAITRIVQPAADIPKNLVKSSSMVATGDVITFNYLRLGHEGVVTCLNEIPNSNPFVIKVDLVHFNYPGISGTRTVVREAFFFDLKTKRIWVYDFTGEIFLDSNEVVKKANEEVQKQDFNLFSNRSSHLCRYCKTGNRELKKVPYRKVKEIGDIETGDIINFYYYGFSHDAVVIQVGIPESIQWKVVHYKYNGIFGTRRVEEEEFTFKLEDQDLFVHNYCGYDVFLASEVVKRAKSKIGEEKFNTFTIRSSHVAKWCKTGDVLFSKHTLVDKSLRMVIRKVREQKENIPDADLARITEDRNLSTYTTEQLSMEFEGLTGWSVDLVLSQAHQKRNLQNVQHLVHFTILHANDAPPSKSGVVLKKGHSLIGKPLYTVISKVEAQGEIIPDCELARLDKDIALTVYSLEELSNEFEKLTEWPVKVLMRQARRYVNLKNVRHLVHFTILEANIKGAPRAMAFNRSFKE